MQLSMEIYQGCILVRFRASGSVITMKLSPDDAKLLGGALEHFARNMPYEEAYISSPAQPASHSEHPENGESGIG